MPEEIRKLEPKKIWNNFADLSQVPRPSKREEKAVEYVKSFGEKLGLETLTDEAGNVVIRKPATPGMENRKMVTFQSHVDMVHQKNSDVTFDFEREGIQTYIDGGWVKAKGTTLGSDNGIGVATALAVLESDDIAHGPVEALFTVDEETGMTGAFALKPGVLKGDYLLNLDSEEEGELYIGCAGGVDTLVEWDYEPIKPQGDAAFQVVVSGLKGGHSGMDIKLGRGNSNKLMARFLLALTDDIEFQLAPLEGGTARNAIPRETTAVVVFDKSETGRFDQALKQFLQTIRNEYGDREPHLKLEANATEVPSGAMNAGDQQKLLWALHATVNGPLQMSHEVDGLVETSSNLSKIKLAGGKLEMETLQRSAIDTARDNAATMFGAPFHLLGATVRHEGAYPGWQPAPQSEILQVMQQEYQKMFGKKPVARAEHAGLECGIIGAKYPGMELISFGPTIENPHSPDEKAHIKSVQKFWDYLLEVLKAIPER